MNVLVVAAHPDDEVLGAAGTIARHVQAGDQVTIAILGEGITSRAGNPEQDNTAQIEHLGTNARDVAKLLGVQHTHLFSLPDNRFDSIDLLDVVKLVEQVGSQAEPDVVYTHFCGDLNIDHEITCRAVMTAFRPLPGAKVRRILAFEIPSSTGWGPAENWFSPTWFVDIEDTLEMKLQAMRIYGGEVREYPHPRSPKSMAERAGFWGGQVGLKAAEPFLLLRELVR